MTQVTPPTETGTISLGYSKRDDPYQTAAASDTAPTANGAICGHCRSTRLANSAESSDEPDRADIGIQFGSPSEVP